jgi:hypothetical protein
MKRIFLFFTALLICTAAAQSAKAQMCPQGWTEATEVIVYNSCTYVCTFCYGLDNLGYHCISLARIDVAYDPGNPGCDGSDFELYSKEIVNALLIQIVQRYDILVEFLGEYEIPPCPNSICLLRLFDAFCYNGWKLNDEKTFYEMQKCDNEIRSCNEVIRICWTLINGQQVIQVDRIGGVQGPECKRPCKTNCG